MKSFIVAIMLCFTSLVAMSQTAENQYWGWIENESAIENADRRYIIPEKYKVYELKLSDLIAFMSNCPSGKAFEVESSNFLISFPYPDGEMHSFKILETPLMPEVLGNKYPGIKTYTGIDVNDPVSYLKMDITPQGFHALVYTSKGEVYIDPYNFGDTDNYLVYYKHDLLADASNQYHCDVTDEFSHEDTQFKSNAIAGDCQLRTYVAAIAATGEYTAFHGNTTNALAAINTTINRVNSVYERDLSVTFTLVSNNNLIVYSNSSTDPYNNSSSVTMLSQNVSNLSTVIGNSNFDIGHVFGVGSGGVASLGSVCGSSKARGVSQQGSPVGDPFDIDYVSHEMGHQFGGNHTQNANCNRVSGAAYEPGSAVTIMGYAGVCSPYNVQSNSDAMFHANSIREISNFITLGNGNSCATKTILSNSEPTVSAGPDKTIPKSTPFLLEASGSDVDADPLTYSWEQWDPEFGQVMPPASTNTLGPLFRTFVPEGPKRYFPNINAILNNTNPTYEVLPSVARSMEFRVVVRDNNPGAGCNDEDNMNITVASNSGPFVVTSPNTSSVSWTGFTTETVTWNVAGTNNSPVNCSDVYIILSTNGGFGYHDTLAVVPNTGSAIVNVPNINTTKARIMVKGFNNIFFDVSNQNFLITPSIVPICPTPANISTSNITATAATLNWTSVPDADHYIIRGNKSGFSGFVTLIIPNSNTTSLNVSNLEGNTSYFWQIRTSCNTDQTFLSSWSASNNFTTLNCVPPTTIFTDDIGTNKAKLNWTQQTNAVNYTVRGGLPGGGFVTLNISGSSASYPVFGLATGTTYVWQIRSNCLSTIRSHYTPLTSFTTDAPTAKLSADVFNVYPNPSTGIFSLSLADVDLKNALITVTNYQGSIIKQLDRGDIQSNFVIDLSGNPLGVYFINFQNGNESFTRKLLVIDAIN